MEARDPDVLQEPYLPSTISIPFAFLPQLYAIYAFSVRYHRRKHMITLIGLLGMVISLLLLIVHYSTMFFYTHTQECNFPLANATYALAQGLWLSLSCLHLTIKSRLLNVVEGTWTLIQKICLLYSVVGPFAFVANLLIGQRVNFESGFCYDAPPAWVYYTGGVVVVLGNILPTSNFVGPMVNHWAKLRKLETDGDTSRFRLFWSAVMGRMASKSESESFYKLGGSKTSQRSAKTPETFKAKPSLGVEGTPARDPTLSTETIHINALPLTLAPTQATLQPTYGAGPGHERWDSSSGPTPEHHIVEPTYPSQGLSVTSKASVPMTSTDDMRPHEIQSTGANNMMKQQALLVRRAFLASLLSFTSTMVNVTLAAFDVLPSRLANLLWISEISISAFCVALALPFPQESGQGEEVQTKQRKKGIWARFGHKV